LAIALAGLLGMSQIVHAQWSRTAPNVYLTTGTDKVGIGTTSPETKLYINDQTAVSSFTGINNTGLRIHSFDNPSNNYALLGFSGYSSAYKRNLAQIGANFTNSGSSIFFGTSNSFGSGITNIAMTINPHGYVGIGTSFPTLKLDVTGDAVFNGVRIGTGNGNASFNTTVGNGALNSNTSGFLNTVIGFNALYTNSSGAANTATGANALNKNTTGTSNTATGDDALFSNINGNYNVAIGGSSLRKNTSGSDNTALGMSSLPENTSGSANTAAGGSALHDNTTGNYNVAIGPVTLYANTTGSLNTALGYGATVSAGTFVRATAIGAGAIVNATNRMQLGSSTATISTSGGYTIVSDGRFKTDVKTDDAPGLAFIKKLRPVAYYFNYKTFDDFLRKDMTTGKTITDEYKQELVEKGKQRQVGFIAQEVDQICRDNKFTFNGVYTPQNSGDNYALDYGRFVVPLVKAVQELSLENDRMKEEINQLKAAVSKINMNNGTTGIPVDAAPGAPLLGQNIPNPAAGNTIIPFRIPKNCKSASIVIAEAGSGRIVNAIPVSCSETHLAINSGMLASGSYTYSLYINGKWVDSKQMILMK